MLLGPLAKRLFAVKATTFRGASARARMPDRSLDLGLIGALKSNHNLWCHVLLLTNSEKGGFILGTRSIPAPPRLGQRFLANATAAETLAPVGPYHNGGANQGLALGVG